MTTSLHIKAKQAAAWTCVPPVTSPDAGKVCLMMSSDFCGYMEPSDARSLAADLLRDADAAEAAAAAKVAP